MKYCKYAVLIRGSFMKCPYKCNNAKLLITQLSDMAMESLK